MPTIKLADIKPLSYRSVAITQGSKHLQYVATFSDLNEGALSGDVRVAVDFSTHGRGRKRLKSPSFTEIVKRAEGSLKSRLRH